MWHGTFIFTHEPVYNWYLSSTALLLNISYSLHNVIAWLKNKPLLSLSWSRVYIGTVILVQPYWAMEITANFLYFSGKNDLYVSTRPYEALCRDPWWIFTVCNLFYNIQTRYEFGYLEIMRVSPRFAILLGAMILSIAFIILDILSVTRVIAGKGVPDGINPFWKLAFVFKCLTDTIILDDFKTALDRLKQYKLERMGSVLSDGVRADFVDVAQARRKKAEQNELQDHGGAMPELQQTTSRDWSKAEEPEHLDLESALRTDLEQEGESPRFGGG